MNGARFDSNQPWDFGYLPSTYFDTLSEEQKGKAKLRNIGLDYLDELHALATAAPDMRRVEVDDIINLSIGACSPDMIPLCLVASHCKPTGDGSIPVDLAEDVICMTERYQMPTRKLPSTRNGFVRLISGYSNDIIDAMVDQEKRFNEGGLEPEEFHLGAGILYGYPIGEVFSFAFEYDPKKGNSILRPGPFFASVPTGWSMGWKAKVGEKGLNHLSRVYCQSISDWQSMETSPLAQIF